VRLIVVALLVGRALLSAGAVGVGVQTAAGGSLQELPPSEAPVPSDSGNLVGGTVRGGETPNAKATMTSSPGTQPVPEVPTPGARSPSRPRSCQVHWSPGGLAARTENQPLVPAVGPLTESEWYYQACHYTDTGELYYSSYWQYTPGAPAAPGPDLGQMAREAFDAMDLRFPVPYTSPLIDVDQIVGLPTWFWIDPAGWQPAPARAELPGFWVEVTATPRHVVWDTGDGGSVTCDGPGTPYDLAGGDGQWTDCSHVFQYDSSGEPGGRYSLSATIVWDIAWTASTGARGDLADASRQTSFDLSVTEMEAVVSYDE
jgi:hypothetical protein